MKVILLALLAMLSVVSAAHADDAVLGREGRAEVRFLEGMIDHHQMALDMANDCLAQADTESMRTLCQNNIDAQSAEIETMRGWLLNWYQIEYAPVSMLNMDADSDTATTDHSAHQHGGSAEAIFTDPPMMMGMMAGLNRLEGVDYEITWLESMIDHHDDALHMSERVLTRAQHPELIALAEQIIVDQTAEIEMMETLIETLSA